MALFYREGTSPAVAVPEVSVKTWVPSTRVTNARRDSLLSCNTTHPLLPASPRTELHHTRHCKWHQAHAGDIFSTCQTHRYCKTSCCHEPRQKRFRSTLAQGFFCLVGVFLGLIGNNHWRFLNGLPHLKNSVLLQGKKAGVNRWPKSNRPEK